MRIQHIPLTQINETAFPRDRTHIEPRTLDALTASIRTTGLRHPIELCEQNGGYALISGYCRLQAFKKLCQFSDTYAQIPAMIRDANTAATALLLMVEEQANRCEIYPWDQGRIAFVARNLGCFDTLDDAVNTLYQSQSYPDRVRLRKLANMFETL